MSLAVVHSRAQVGVLAPPVLIEAHLANGLPTLTLVGLPEATVKESKDRVRSALVNSRLEFPQRRITLSRRLLGKIISFRRAHFADSLPSIRGVHTKWRSKEQKFTYDASCHENDGSSIFKEKYGNLCDWGLLR